MKWYVPVGVADQDTHHSMLEETGAGMTLTRWTGLIFFNSDKENWQQVRNEWTTARRGWQNGTDLEKCTHQYGNKTKNRETITHERFRRYVSFGWKQIDRHQKKKEVKLLLVYPVLFFLLLLCVYLFSPEEDESSKELVCYCFPVFCFIGEYICSMKNKIV